MAQSYTPEQITEALVILASLGGDIALASERTGIPASLLRKWQVVAPTQTIPEMLEAAITRMLARMPESWPPSAWAESLSLLIDKLLLLRHDELSQSELMSHELQALSDSQRKRIIDEANRIISRAGRSPSSSGDSRDVTR